MSTAAVWQGSDAELLAELGALETRLHSTWAQMLSVVAEIDSRGMASGLGYGSTVALVRAVARVSRGEAQARIPPHVAAEQRAEVETQLAQHARTLDAGQLMVLGKRILAYLDQDGPLPQRSSRDPAVAALA